MSRRRKIALSSLLAAGLFVVFQNCSQAFRETPLVDAAAIQASIANPTNWQNPSLILAQPQDHSFYAGETFTLNVEAKAVAGTTYQWYKNTQPMSSGNGATTKTLTIASASDTDQGFYWVVINRSGQLEQSRTITVSKLAGAAASAPVIVASPQPVGEVLGASVAFQFAYTSTSAISVQWFKNGQPIANSNSNPLVLRLDNIGTADQGVFFVRVSNGSGSTDSQPASLSLYQ